MGCVLGQHDETGKKERAIYYLSKKFTEYEAKYSSVEKLCCALGFNNLLEQDDKGDVSAETTGLAPAEVSAGTQISAERHLCYWLIPKSE
ncbi:hypothetical protein V6N13_109355 [Hibiscus sabdariffa]